MTRRSRVLLACTTAAVLVAVVAIQVVLQRWAYLAYKRAEVHCAPAYPDCLGLRLYRPPFDMPLWGYILLWFGVDLALLLVTLWLIALQAAWSRHTLGRVATFAAVTLAIQVSLGYWWVIAYGSRPNLSCSDMHLDPTLLARCNRLVARMTLWENTTPVYVLIIWLGVDLALLWCASRLLSDRSRLGLQPRQERRHAPA
jgi:hypothetical protein